MQFYLNFEITLVHFFTIISLVSSKKISIPGDIILGGIFPIHQKGTKMTNEHGQSNCGSLNKDRGVQRVEAMLFAIDKINRDNHLLPGIKIGAIILDTCSSDSYALNQSLEFIRASINTAFESSAFECGDGSTPRPRHGMQTISGVIGGSYSEVSLQVANLLRLFKIPQISYASTSTSLSDKKRYEFFARTVPPDKYQALALVDFIQSLNWTYVSLISSEGQYGESGVSAFKAQARQRNICFAIQEKVPQTANDTEFDRILASLMKKDTTKAVVLFLRMEDAKGLLHAVKRANMSEKFTWIASDGWGKELRVIEGVEDVAHGAITLELQSALITEFDKYMLKLNLENNKRNPWFQEYWEEMFKCRFPSELINSGNWYPKSQYFNNNLYSICSPNLNLNDTDYRQESKVQFVIDAVYAFAHAINNARLILCHGMQGICDELKQLDQEIFYKNYLLNVSFEDLQGSEVRFDECGDGLARYNIYNFQSYSSSNEYINVGSWSEDELIVNLNQIVWNADDQREVPTSVCSPPCKVGEVKKGEDLTCCWVCQECKAWEYTLDERNCADCGFGRWPYSNKTSCYDLPLQYIKWDTPYAYVPIGISILGIMCSIFVIYVFIKHIDTPIVKASGRELCLLLMTGILVCYVMTFVILAKPTTLSCSFQRFGIGLGFSIIYGAILTKTNRISRIFDSARRSAQRPNYISPKSQIVITFIIVLVQVLLTGVWFLLENPGTRLDMSDKRDEVILKCAMKNSSVLYSLIYTLFLVLTCTVYAFKTRKIPENFNETKFIGFAMYATCIIWVAFFLIYLSTGNKFEVQLTTLCTCVSLSAYVALICFFSPKVYIIIFNPNKNVRKLTMNSVTYKKGYIHGLPFPAEYSRYHPTTSYGSCIDQITYQIATTSSVTIKEKEDQNEDKHLIFEDGKDLPLKEMVYKEEEPEQEVNYEKNEEVDEDEDEDDEDEEDEEDDEEIKDDSSAPL